MFSISNRELLFNFSKYIIESISILLSPIIGLIFLEIESSNLPTREPYPNFFPESISIKIRLKLGSSGNNYIVSDELTLNSEYNLYEFEFDINETYDAHKLQVLCGNAIGEYFFDNFETIINDQSFSNYDETLQDVVFFPIPFENNLYFNSNQNLDVSIYSIDGKLISILKLQGETGKVNLDFLEKGVYILKYFVEGVNYYKRIIKN